VGAAAVPTGADAGALDAAADGAALAAVVAAGFAPVWAFAAIETANGSTQAMTIVA